MSIAVGSALLSALPAAAQKKGYEEWLRQQQQEYKQFLNEQDKAFLTFLKKEWTSVRVDTTAASSVDNKPRQIPRADDTPTKAPPAEEPPRNEPPRNGPPLPPPDRPFAEEDSAADPERFRDQKPPSEPDSFPQNGEEQPDDMEEATAQLDAATGEQPLPEPPSASQETPPSEPTPPPENPPPGEEAETATLNREASLSFFGVSTTVPYGAASVPSLEGAPSKSSIRRFWKTMGKGPYRPTLGAVQKQREELGLSDWGYYLYLKDLGARLYGDASSNERVLWTWFMLMKSGYAARVGYRGSEVFLMLPVDQKIFGRPQMHIDGQRYYLMVESIGGSLRTYKEQHAEADGVLRLDESSLPVFEATSKRRTVAFTFQDERHELEIAYNPATVDYLQAYPNVELEVLFGAGVSSTARTAFEKTLQPLVVDRPPREALNLLLTFAQFATDYKRDQEHFGEERYLFPEESLASDYSDCEDRAVLLAYLTRTLLGRKVVGLQWPNHVALAVRTGSGLRATSEDPTVTVDGDTYIYADPTYIGSDLGMKMPLVEGQTPEIITVKR
ncbi:hypothetical protein [Salinibacter ruber]|uniref:hypothetical protein n=1 Tax=Salinibacter ruber TaxID=146919 RepID=UPI00207455B8|nr:hypothetical protein [Salinibacter ruber]